MTQTRYERVKEILARAAGESAADYAGLGRFWELPLPRLLEVTIHGVRMIAPVAIPAVKSCCATASSAEARRGAVSGLVQGLRGEAPFDGSRFPRLPWGGTVVADEDIQFISDWIDDGCPPEDREIARFALPGLIALPTLELISHDNVESAALADSANEYKYQHGELKQRMNIDCMSPAQIDRFRFAFRELYKLNKWPGDRRNYNNLAQIHQNHCQHGWERFLPWHRVYMYEFEQALQDHCPELTMPYWDWTMPQYRPEHPEKGWIIPKSLQCFLTAESIVQLQKANPPLPKAQGEKLKPVVGVLFSSQQRFFDAVRQLIDAQYTQGEYRNRFIDALLATNALWYPLRYPAEYKGGGTINQVIHYHYPTAEDMEQIMSLSTFRDFGGGSLYNDAFGYLDQNPHNTMHLWTGGMNPDAGKTGAVAANDAAIDRNRSVEVAGRLFHTRKDLYSQPAFGDMFSNLTASYDPVFWPIHANIDRVWWEWQQAHPQALPADLGSALTPWSYTIGDVLDIYRFGYEYVKSTHLIPVGLEAPVGRFVSKPLTIAEPVRAAFRQAEVRLHRVPQLVRSCFIRIFLNVPDANAATPITHEGYAGYLAIFGHADCYGGPGHCELPPDVPRKFDRRPRNHNTPRNHRINVTKAAQRLLTKSSTLQITLVVIGVDYQEDRDLLRLDGVSLNFFD